MAQEESRIIQVFERTSVVFVNGPPRSGKDTFAGQLREILSVSMMARRAGMVPIPMKFAEPIKSGVRAAFALSSNQAMADFETPAKDVPSPRYYGKTPREVLISFSEHWLKPAFGNNIFGRLALHRMERQATSYPEAVFIFSDSGFQSEFAVVYDAFKAVNNFRMYGIHMHREGCTFAGDSRSYIDFLGARHYNIQNDGSELQLQSIARTIAEDIIANQ